MKYFKQVGSVYDFYYAVNLEKKEVTSIERRCTDKTKTYIDSYLVTSYAASRGTYDQAATNAILKLEEITQKEWRDAKKDVADYTKMMGVTE